MESFYFLFFEFGTLLVFLAILARERINREMREVLILALAYGLILEILNVNFSGSYRYSGEFALRIFGVPIAIGIGWAIIYYLAFKTAGIYRLKWWHSPFLMALIAVSVDLIFDIIAVRLGFWQWSIPLNQEWFGVPYDNLFGWMAVVWTFTFLMNLSRQNFVRRGFSRLIKYLAVIVSPFLLGLQINAYATLAALLSARFSPSEIWGFYQRNDFSYAYYLEVQTYKAYIFWLIVAVLILYLVRIIYKNSPSVARGLDKFSFSILTAMHLLFLVAIFTAGLYKQTPAFVLIALAMLAFHLIVSLWPKYRKL
jgi:bisanhydrobacterioruberin hydratase